MKLSTVKKLFPQSTWTQERLNSREYLVLFDGLQYLNIPRDDITDAEVILLEEIFNTTLPMSPWHQYLVNGTKINDLDIEMAQLIHFTINNSSSIKYEWLKSFSDIFESTQASFYVEENYGIVIVERLTFDKEEILGILNMLDEDHSVSTAIYIGTLVDTSLLHEVFIEERKIFKHARNNQRVTDFSNSYSSYYLVDSLVNSKVSMSIKNTITNQKDIPRLIVSLWKNQGNQSAVAKELFVHRNTINYRVERLYEDYGIDLKDIDQLFLCYLLLK